MIGIGVLASYACDSDTYSCSSDEQCANGPAPGTCQLDTGWCSFEDTQCPSMQRYGALATQSLANTCVPLQPEPQSPASSSASAPASPLPGPDTTTGGRSDDPPGADPSGDETTPGSDMPPASTTGTPDDESSGGGDEGGTTGDPAPGCTPLLFDDFGDAAVGPEWYSWIDAGTTLVEADSMLRFSIVGPVNGSSDSGLNSKDLFDLTEGQMRIEVAEFPTPGSNMRIYLQWQGDGCTETIMIKSDEVHAFGELGESGEETAWFQLRSDGMLVHAEHSADGVVWEPIVAPQPLGCDLHQTRVLAFGGAGGPGSAGPTAALETLEVCVPSP